MTLCSYLFLALFSSSITSATDIPSRNKDLLEATEEMQRANYFTFVMLINMAPSELFLGNVTFLMPNDRTLSKTVFPENGTVDFLLQHSIPSPLLFDHLLHLPTNSMIPTSKPDSMLKVSNDGRQRFFLDNVRIRSPNICTAGSSIRCHGIDGVVQVVEDNVNNAAALPWPSCPNATVAPVSVAAAPGPLPSPAPSVDSWFPSAAPTAVATPQKSGGSSSLLSRGRPLAGFTMTFMMLLAV